MEETDSNDMRVESFANEQYDPKMISQHIELLIDAGYISAIKVTHMGSPYEEFIITRINMLGHDYLDNVRDPKVWRETKTKIGQLGYSVTLDMVKMVASKVIMTTLGM